MIWTATILDDSPRAATWRKVFGGTSVPVTSPVPVAATAPGLEGPQLFYQVAVAQLTPDQRTRVVLYLAEQFRVSPAEVEAGLDDPAQGLPILATDVAVTTRLRFVL